jgi:Ca2+-transporting ATPase
VHALREGRRLHDNLVHALAFYLGAKLGLVALFVAGTLWRGFPLAPVQVIVLELYMDVGASTSFVAEPAVAGIMARPPRAAAAPFFDAIMLARIAAGGTSMLAAVLGGYAWGAARDDARGGGGGRSEDGAGASTAHSMAFVCWMMAHVALAANQRTATEPVLLTKSWTTNRVYIAWVAATALLCVLVGVLPGLDAALALRTLAARDWGVAVGIVAVSTCWIEAVKMLAWTVRRPGGWRLMHTRRAPVAAAAPAHEALVQHTGTDAAASV